MNNNKNNSEPNKKPPNSNSKKKYYEKTMVASKLINEESNRIISWAMSIIGGSILIILSTQYVNPTGWILYAYFLFIVGWYFLGKSVFHGEAATRIYIAGITTPEDEIKDIGRDVDNEFAKQIKSFRSGVITFVIWLLAFLIWFIIFKK